MGARIALCVDEVTCANPGMLGLDDVRLDAQPWLDVYTLGEEARRELASRKDVEEVWVASSEDIEAINLAATLKSDCPSRTVRLLGFEAGGSLPSRAHAASIDEVMSLATFADRYAREKRAVQEVQTQTARIPDESAVIPKLENAPATSVALALSSHAPAVVASSVSGFVMPVVSGSGGAGKSTVSVLAAYSAHALGYRTLLLDYDLQFGDASVMMGIEAPLTIDEVLQRPDRLEREASHLERPALVAPPERLEMAESVVHAIPELLEQLLQTFDVIVANTGAAWAEQHAVLLERSTAALFLIDQRSSSVRACRHALGLCARCGIATGQFRYVLNRCAKGAPLTGLDVSCALQGVSVMELRDGGRDVEDYLAAGAVDDFLQTGNDLYMSVNHLVSETLPDGACNQLSIAEESGIRLPGRRKGRHVGKRRGWGK